MILNYNSYSTSMLIVPLKSRSPPILTPTTIMRSSRTGMQSLTMSAYKTNNNSEKSTPNYPSIDNEQLRTQLDQLQAEADIARSKANVARLRLMRLSEAAENLQRQAATDIQVGKESEARELLIQKKKLMQALANTKNRIEVLDKLSAKLNEAISVKETQLLGNVSMYAEVSQQEAGPQIRFISPKDNIDEDSNKNNDSDGNCTKSGQNQELEAHVYQTNMPVDCDELINEESASIEISNSAEILSSLNSISSYEDFLEHVDGQLKQVESDLVVFLRVSSLILASEQKQKNTKVQQISGILGDMRSIRGRIAGMMKEKTDVSLTKDKGGDPQGHT